ncbi:MAG: aromatic-ring-hydroxylating dioxygenase subunit beta [Gammaproteobacteria bacterium]|nr:aromatic-ring-hydroxylating dioxygenase subunit beta [Gammaproteobacteria bacterium]
MADVLNFTTLSAVELQHHVEYLLARYVHCIDDDELERLPDFFTDDCVYQVIARENADRNLPLAAIYCASKGMLCDRITALRHANIYERHRYRHVVSSVLVTGITTSSAHVKSNYVVYRTRTNGVSELFNAGTYLDTIVVDGRLLFKEKRAIFDTNRIDTLLVTPI